MSAPQTTSTAPPDTMVLVKELEQSAAARHLEAQQLNKEGRYEGAAATLCPAPPKPQQCS
jgi:hypothetical protein